MEENELVVTVKVMLHITYSCDNQGQVVKFIK